MRKYFFLILITLGLFLTLVPSVFSADDTSRLQQIENKVATSSPTSTNSATAKDKSITYTSGTLTAINSSILIINSQDATKIVYTNDSTKFFNIDSSGKKLIGLGDLKVGDPLVILGLEPNTTSGTAKFVVRTSEAINKSFSFLAKIADVHDNSLVLVDFSGLNSSPLSLTLPAEITFAKDSNVKKAADLKKNDKLVVVGTIDDKGNLSANQISVFK